MRALRGLASIFVLSLVACSSGSGTSRVQISLGFDDSVSDAALARVKTLVVQASADETDSFPITLGRPAMRTELLAYLPAPGTRTLALAIDAYDESGVELASGMSAQLSIAATGAQSITIALSAVDVPDAGVQDLGDLASPPDSSTLPPAAAPPSFVNSSTASNTSASTLTVPAPTGIVQGTLLLAMAGGTVDAALLGGLSFTPPAGWSTLATISTGSGAGLTTATWFWKLAGSSEPATYVFNRNSAGTTTVLIGAYTGAKAIGGSAFEGTATRANASASTGTFASITTTRSLELIVVNGYAPDVAGETWGDPSGETLCSAGPGMSAAAVMRPPGLFTPSTSALGSSSRTLTLTTAILSE